MGIYTGYADAPEKIIQEGSSITLAFTRTSDTAGVVSWNIPPPSAGCDELHRAYNGIVITGALHNELQSEKPVDHSSYVGDPTMDTNLHAGSKLAAAMVLGGFYNDVVTTSVMVTGLTPGVPYYFNAYAVDQVLQYHQAGVHSYSLGNNPENVSEAKPAIQRVSYGPITATDGTNYQPGQLYKFSFIINGVKKTFTFAGDVIQTFGDLVAQFNIEFSRLGSPTISVLPPLTGSLYWNAASKLLFRWDGYKLVAVDSLFVQSSAPNDVADGSYWINTSTGVISVRSSGTWNPVDAIRFPTDPAAPSDEDVWIDGTTAHIWDGYVWKDASLYDQASDPAALPILTAQDFWLTGGVLKQWQDSTCDTPLAWVIVSAITTDTDPNNIIDGDLWFTGQMLYTRTNNVWVTTPVEIRETSPSPVAGKYWYQPSTNTLYLRNLLNSEWVATAYVGYTTDPTIRESAQLWLTSTDVLKIWDSVTSSWVLVTGLHVTPIDPKLTPNLPIDSVWRPSPGMVRIWDGSMWCPLKPAIEYPTDPRVLPNGVLWYDTTNNILKKRLSGSWIATSFTITSQDPALPIIGAYWFNSGNQVLSIWNGAAWIPVQYGTSPIIESVGMQWLNPNDLILREWDGNTWNVVPYNVTATLASPYIIFTTRRLGSEAELRVDGDVQTSIGFMQSVPTGIVVRPSTGQDEVLGTSSFEQLGVGTDGSSDDRRKMISQIMMQLGHPAINLELVPAQYDLAIDQAIQEIRMKSGSALRKEFFFLKVKSGQHVYTLSDKHVGFNRIVHIIKITRQRSGYLASYDNTVFADAQAQYLYQQGHYDLASLEIQAGYGKQIEKMFASNVMYTWNDHTRQLKLQQSIRYNDKYLLECAVERTEQELINDRYLANWIQDFARAECLMMIGMIRGKFTSLPGPGGGVSLNGPEMIQQAIDLQTELKEELANFQVDNPDEWLGGILWG